MPKISIILPIYNVEKYLDECLKSVTHQTLKDIEIICVIDASPDHSIDVCEKWQTKDKRIVIVDEKVNKGLGLTRNVGLKYVHGEYVAFVDSDDYIDVEMYERMYDYAQENSLDTCFCDYLRDTDGVISESKEPKDSFTCLGREDVDEYLFDMLGPLPEYPSDVKHLVSVWRGIYSMKIIRRFGVRFESERLNASEDIPFNIDYLMKAERIGYIPFKGYYYRYNPVSLSRGYTHKKFQAYQYLLNEVKERLETYCDSRRWKLHYERFVFYTLRCIIKYEAIKDIDGNKMNNIRMRCDDSMMIPLYKDYPYKRFHIKQRVFFFCMKHRLVWMLYWMCILENKIHKVI